MTNTKCARKGISSTCQCYQCRRIHAFSVRFQTVLINRYLCVGRFRYHIASTRVYAKYTLHKVTSYPVNASGTPIYLVISFNYGNRRNIPINNRMTNHSDDSQFKKKQIKNGAPRHSIMTAESLIRMNQFVKPVNYVNVMVSIFK